MATETETITPVDYRYPPELPVCAHRDEILAALGAHRVVVVSGDTGSGKTTQLPKMALEAGFGVRGRIAVTQPRRLAAVTMAERVAAELGGEVGGLVGFQHRFGRRLGPETRVKFMTDGVLLAETRTDPLLRHYDCIVVDEAHERSLNVDFLLGILKRVLARRRDLSVIVSSATLDTERFSAFFGGAPVISVPGRLFPIEVRWLPPPEDDERDLARDVADAVALLPAKDDVLVFLPGERDIRETAETLEGRYGASNEIIPLLASLPADQQRRAFRLAPRRRIVLATNVAETSVTIPGIRAVIDSGLARISRYVPRTQVQRLQIEPISQASARQRAGRCGRLGPGTCIRLYSEEDFAQRDPFTPPEVLRASLAGVILTMLDLRLGDVAEFPFIDPPRPTAIREGYRELLELGAIGRSKARGLRSDGGGEREIVLTGIGRMLAKIPVEPRLARMLVAASDAAVLPSVLPVVAALACDDPRRRPIDEREKADQAHAPFRVAGSDFLGTLALWNWWTRETKNLSQAKSRALAKKTYLSFPKMREWRDLVRQLEDLAKRLGLSFAECGARGEREDAARAPRPQDDFTARFHRALLSGLLGHLGRYDEEEGDYRGAHGLRFALHPGSVLTKKLKTRGAKRETRNSPNRQNLKPSQTFPAWLMAGELVDTARLFARNAAAIDPSWIEPVAGDLCRHSYHTPVWDAERGFARVTEQVTLYGLVVVPARRRDLFHIDPALARRIFIERGLVAGEFPHPPPVVAANAALLDALRRRADKCRRPDLVDAAKLYAHFDAALPEDVASADALRRWLRRARPDEIDRFKLRKKDWWPTHPIEDRDFPDKIRLGGVTLALEYRNAPQDPDSDGITCTVRARDAHVLRLWKSEWLVPGALPEKITWMLSVLPSSLRRVLVPLDEKVTVLLSKLQPGAEPLAEAVRRAVDEEWGFRIPSDAWDRLRMPAHFSVRYRVRDDRTGRVLAETRNLDEVLSRFPVDAAPSPRHPNGSDAARMPCLRSWVFGTIPAETTGDHAGWTVKHYPALRDEGDGVTLRLYDDAATAERVHAQGVARLFRLTLPANLRLSIRTRDLPLDASLRLKEMDYSSAQLAEDAFAGAIAAALVTDRPSVRTAEEFARRAAERNAFIAAESEILKLSIGALAEAARLVRTAESAANVPAETAVAVGTQLAWLVFNGFPAHVPLERLRRYARYLKAIALRIERARNSPASDRAKEALFAPHWTRYADAATGRDKTPRDPAALADYRWMLEEYRVSLFAQELHTPEPVSPKRLDAKWGETTR